MSSSRDIYSLYVEVAELLDRGHSLRDVSRNLAKSNSSLGVMLERLERQFGVPLYIRSSIPASSSRLTREGKELLRRVAHVVAWEPHAEKAPLNLSIPQSILNSQVLTRGIDTLIAGDEKLDVRLQVRDSSELAQLCTEVDAGLVDIAIAWILDPEKLPTRQHTGRSRIRICDAALNAVIISNSTRNLLKIPSGVFKSVAGKPSCNTALLADFMRGQRLAVMSPENQPLNDVLVGHDEDKNQKARRVSVANLDSAVSCVATRVVDFAVVPFLPSHLTQHQLTGSLCWSNPVGEVHIALVHTGGGVLDRHGELIASRLEALLKAEATLGMEYEGALEEFPESAEEYLRLSIGYYIDVDRAKGSEDFVAQQSTKWRWEKIQLEPRLGLGEEGAGETQERLCLKSGNCQLIFDGTAQNSLHHRFEILALASQVREQGRLLAIAHQTGYHAESSSVPTFVTVLTRCIRVDDNNIALAGMWIGLNKDDMPAAYATIWSQRPLEESELQGISQRILSRPVLMADCDRDFSQQAR